MQTEEPQPPPPRRIEIDSGEDIRFFFAAERTLLVWVRTSVAMIGLGFVVARFGLFLQEVARHAVTATGQGTPAHPVLPIDTDSPTPSFWIGIGLILLGVIFCALAGREHARYRRRFLAGLPYEIPAVSTALVLSAILTVLGLIMAGYLVLVVD